MKKRRIILAIAGTTAIIIITGILISASLIFGNPISKSIAKSQVKNYLDVVYSDSNINNSYYNLIGESYVFECTIEGEQRYITYKDKKIRDDYVESYYRDEFSKDLAELELNNINANAVIDTYIIADGDYSTDFDKLNINTNMMLNIVNNSPEALAKDRKKAATTATNQILEALNYRYNIKNIDVWYTDTFGSYNITIQN